MLVMKLPLAFSVLTAVVQPVYAVNDPRVDVLTSKSDEPLKNLGEDCWKSCNRKDGYCPGFCGSKGLCCRIGFEGGGCDGSIGEFEFHTCVLPNLKFGDYVMVKDNWSVMKPIEAKQALGEAPPGASAPSVSKDATLLVAPLDAVAVSSKEFEKPSSLFPSSLAAPKITTAPEAAWTDNEVQVADGIKKILDANGGEILQMMYTALEPSHGLENFQDNSKIKYEYELAIVNNAFKETVRTFSGYSGRVIKAEEGNGFTQVEFSSSGDVVMDTVLLPQSALTHSGGAFERFAVTVRGLHISERDGKPVNPEDGKNDVQVEFFGSRRGHIAVFRGIPFATADLFKHATYPRFEQLVRGGSAEQGRDLKTPSPAFNAVTRKVPCQNGESKEGQDQASSKECLRLDIYMPVISSSQVYENIPVFVYFTGSCFGAGAQTDGTQIVRNFLEVAKEPIIFVSLQFRAGALGHSASEGLLAIDDSLLHDGLHDDGDDAEMSGDAQMMPVQMMSGVEEHSPVNAYKKKKLPKLGGNNVLTDSRLALRWIQEHIHNFGGDPNKVSLFGQSSGGCMVGGHFLSPRSFINPQSGNYSPSGFHKNPLNKPLFTSIISSSGAFQGWCTVPTHVAEGQFEALFRLGVMRKSGITQSHDQINQICDKNDAKYKDCMAKWLVDNLSEYEISNLPVDTPCYAGCQYALAVDNVQIMGTMPEILDGGKPGVDYADVPVLHGYTGDDGFDFLPEWEEPLYPKGHPLHVQNGALDHTTEQEFLTSKEIMDKNIADVAVTTAENMSKSPLVNSPLMGTNSSPLSTASPRMGAQFLSRDNSKEVSSPKVGIFPGMTRARSKDVVSRVGSKKFRKVTKTPPDNTTSQDSQDIIGSSKTGSPSSSPSCDDSSKTGNSKWMKTIHSEETFRAYFRWGWKDNSMSEEFFVPFMEKMITMYNPNRYYLPADDDIQFHGVLDADVDALIHTKVVELISPATFVVSRVSRSSSRDSSSSKSGSISFGTHVSNVKSISSSRMSSLQSVHSSEAAQRMAEAADDRNSNISVTGPPSNIDVGAFVSTLIKNMAAGIPKQGAFWPENVVSVIVPDQPTTYKPARDGEEAGSLCTTPADTPFTSVESSPSTTNSGTSPMSSAIQVKPKEFSTAPRTTFPGYNYLYNTESGAEAVLPINLANKNLATKRYKDLSNWHLAMTRLYSSREYMCPVSFASRKILGKKTSLEKNVYEYAYLWDNHASSAAPLVPHGAESETLFRKWQSLVEHSGVPALELGWRMMKYWTHFATCGNVNGCEKSVVEKANSNSVAIIVETTTAKATLFDDDNKTTITSSADGVNKHTDGVSKPIIGFPTDPAFYGLTSSRNASDETDSAASPRDMSPADSTSEVSDSVLDAETVLEEFLSSEPVLPEWPVAVGENTGEHADGHDEHFTLALTVAPYFGKNAWIDRISQCQLWDSEWKKMYTCVETGHTSNLPEWAKRAMGRGKINSDSSCGESSTSDSESSRE